MDNLPEELIYYLSCVLIKENVIDFIRFTMTCKKFYYHPELKKLLLTSYQYKNLLKDIQLGYNLAKINTYEYRINYFLDEAPACNTTSISERDSMILPYDFLPIMLGYLKNKRRNQPFDITMGWCKFNQGVKLGIIKAAKSLESSFLKENLID